MHTIIGIFDDPTAARQALEALQDSPLTLEDVSIVSRATQSGEAVASDGDVSAGEGAAIGAVWGGLVGLASLLIPGVGPFIALGALGAALTGAVAGAVVGGIAAALIDFGGIPEAEARHYESLVYAGKTLVAAKAQDVDVAEVRRILSSYGASSVREDQPAEAQPYVVMYNERGERVDPTAETQPGIYSAPATPSADPYATRQIAVGERAAEPETWTSGEWIGEGQGAGPRKDTGEYASKQWIGEGQGKPASDDPAKR